MNIFSVGKDLVSVVKGSPIAAAVIAVATSAAILGAIAFIEYRLHAEYKAGGIAERAKMDKEQRKAEAKWAREEMDRFDVLIAQHKAEKVAAIDLQEVLDTKPEVTPHDIIKATSTPDCATLCPANHRVWLDATQRPVGIPERR